MAISLSLSLSLAPFSRSFSSEITWPIQRERDQTRRGFYFARLSALAYREIVVAPFESPTGGIIYFEKARRAHPSQTSRAGTFKGRALTKFSTSDSIMANLRVTPVSPARANFSTGIHTHTHTHTHTHRGTRVRTHTLNFPRSQSSFPFVTVSSPWHGTFSVSPRRKTTCFMHRPAHYRLNVPRGKSFHGREGNFDARRTEREGCVAFVFPRNFLRREPRREHNGKQ